MTCRSRHCGIRPVPASAVLRRGGERSEGVVYIYIYIFSQPPLRCGKSFSALPPRRRRKRRQDLTRTGQLPSVLEGGDLSNCLGRYCEFRGPPVVHERQHIFCELPVRFRDSTAADRTLCRAARHESQRRGSVRRRRAGPGRKARGSE